MQREAMLPACRRVQPNYVRALRALIGFGLWFFFLQEEKEPSLPFPLAAEGSTGAGVGRAHLVLIVETPKPAFTTGLLGEGEGGESSSPVFGRRMQQAGLCRGVF